MTTVDEVLRARAEGLAAAVGTANPYAGRSRALAVAWMGGCREMLHRMVEASRVHQRYIVARRAMFTHAGTSNRRRAAGLRRH